jgi:hypothetical protein
MTDGQFGKMLGMDTDDYFELISAELPLKRLGEPKEIGGFVPFWRAMIRRL